VSRIRRRVLVRGRVQGVFFRDSARRAAERAGVTGWICNRPDGRVEAVFEGPAAAVEALLTWCRTGPAHARVDEVTVVEEAPAGDAHFVIR
jgi:acylphosphatase